MIKIIIIISTFQQQLVQFSRLRHASRHGLFHEYIHRSKRLTHFPLAIGSHYLIFSHRPLRLSKPASSLANQFFPNGEMGGMGSADDGTIDGGAYGGVV